MFSTGLVLLSSTDGRRKSMLRHRWEILVRFGDGIPKLVTLCRLQRPCVRTNVAGTKSEARRVFPTDGIRDGHVWRRSK